MGRNWPPNSFGEWMVGQNFRSQRQPSSFQSPLIRVEISEDDASGDETVAITYPRRRCRQNGKAEGETRKVRFEGEKPLKSALKKTASPNSSDDTLVDTSETSEDAVTTTTGDGSSDANETDTSEDDAPIRREKNKSKKSKVTVCLNDNDSEDSSTDKDVLPHETCACKKCKKGRKILKAIMMMDAKKAADEKEAEAEAKAKEEADAKAKEEADAKAKEEAEAKAKEEASKKEEEAKDKKDKKKEKNKESEELAEKILKAVNKAAFKMPKYPKEMEPNLIMPTRSKVMQVEHAMEGPNDPQPNAFFDASRGIARVYHGPMYGNHMAELYGKCNSAKNPQGSGISDPRGFPPPPPWATHPAYNPRMFGAPPPGYPGQIGFPATPFGHRPPMMNAPPPTNEAEMKAAAEQGFGLSGQPPPQTPAMIRQMKQQEQQNAAVDNTVKNNNGGWNSGGGNGWGDNTNTGNWCKPPSPVANPGPPADTTQGQGWGDNGFGNNFNATWGKSSTPAANPNPPADATQGQSWGENSGGWNSGPKQDGVASPVNFNAWGDNNGAKFERRKSCEIPDVGDFANLLYR